MSLKALRGKGKRWRQNDSLFANGASLKIQIGWIFKSVAKKIVGPQGAYYAESRTMGKDMG